MGFWDKLKSGVSQVWQNVKSEAEDIADSVKQQGADAVCEAAEDEYEQQKQSRLREKHIRENSRVCSSCGRKAADEKFCPECGGKIVVRLHVCEKCGYLAEEEKFCPKCGGKIVEKEE